jgi:hypothetical protein
MFDFDVIDCTYRSTLNIAAFQQLLKSIQDSTVDLEGTALRGLRGLRGGATHRHSQLPNAL